MRSGNVQCGTAPVEVVAILRNADEVHDAERRDARFLAFRELARLEVAPSFGYERNGLAEVVESRPDEFAGDETIALHARELDVGDVGVVGRVALVRADAE